MFDIQNIIGACGMIETQTRTAKAYGTGYLIDPDCVATCWHVVQNSASDGVTVIFKDGPVRARIGPKNAESDCALLMLESRLPAERALRLGKIEFKAPWEGYGYPLLGKKTGVTIEGTVRNWTGTDDLDAPVLELFSPDVAAGMASPLHGYSGSPVVVNEMVVGHLKRFLPDPEDPARPAYGKVFATRSECILALRADVPGASPSGALAASLKAPVPGTPLAREGAERVQRLLAKWRADPKVPDDAAGLAAADSLIQLGAPHQALEVLRTLPAMSQPIDLLRRTQLEALALAKTDEPSNLARSIQILTQLRAEGHMDPESSGILGGRFKQLYLKTAEPRYLQQSYDVYADAFHRTNDYYPGVNAAALALWLKRKPESVELAHKVLAVLDKTQAKPGFWDLATKGEAYLLANDLGRAKLWYGEAAKKCDYAAESIQIMQRQARLNLKELGLDESVLDSSFKPK